ncbi:hypothetical protein P5673_014210 [Acropora cervicornis]|uniref:Uncharacterized protein n=1 Tax=Acropora cervicornis TaxID=6130 RepID=A0AAD9V614_ACRCE|nr:hypothetical protein P5673_014210 [Acropora cervicornis]
MASSKWTRRWLYDSEVKVPKTTRWRRKLEYGGPVTEDGNGDRTNEGDISLIIGGLRNDTSPFKKQKLIDNCLTDDKNDDHFSCNQESQTAQPENEKPSAKFILHTPIQDHDHCIQTEHGVMSSFVSWRQQNAYSESMCLQDELDDCGDTNQLERDGSDTSANDCEDESLTPDLWEKMSCGNGLHEDSDCLDAVDCNNGLELADCYRESLLGELNFNKEIPDMECFKNTPAASSEDQEPLRDEQALYQDSPLSVAESSLLLMAFSVRHKLSGVALEDLLELIQLHCPKPNKCITELKEFQLFFQALKHPVVKHYYCPNLICKLYVATVTIAGVAKGENTYDAG